MLAYVLAIVVVLVAVLLAFGLAPLLHLPGAWYWVFVIAVLLLGIAAAIAIVVLHRRAKKEKEQQGDTGGTPATTELDLALNDANRKLRTAQQGAKTLEALPLVYILGDSGTAKTTTVMKSGLDPELLAGTATHERDQGPTALINLWFTKIAALLEVGSSVRESNTLLTRLVHRTRAKAYRSAFGSGAAPRAVIVCLSADQLLAGDGGESVLASAGATGAQLREISRLLGMPVPVYVIVTKLDRVPHFAEYVHNLTDAEVRQVFGSALPRSEASAGVYAEQASRVLGGVIDGLVYRLGEFRVEVLDRENDPANAPGVYEFPRELGKARKNLTQYLVELCKPSQLSANPYLRGFYFTGVRARIVERVATAPAATEPASPQDAGATQYINLSMGRPQARASAAPVMSSSRVPQWTFLPRLLPEVILGDKSALSATKQSAPARLFRRILFGSLAFLFALWIIFLIVSYINNAGLEHRIQNAARALPSAGPTAISLPSTSDLKALDDLRQTILLLDGYRKDGVPWSYRWGLYQGDTLNAQARRIYFDRFRAMMLNPAQANFLNSMRGLPDAPQPQVSSDNDAYLAAYNPLKAYLITTSHPEKSDPKFLTPVFLQAWTGSRLVDDDQKRLASQQIDFYGNELLRQPPYSIAPDAVLVEHAQIYLSKFLADTRIYQNMLADADKAGTPIDFNRLYPDAVKFVSDTHTVRGAFSRGGFDAMQNALKNPGRYAQGERWVLGDKSSQLPDLATLATSLGSKYQADYLNEWHAFVQGAHVASCGGLRDAPKLLDALAGSTSPILELFFTISHNTAVADKKISDTFQPAQALVDPNATVRLSGPGNLPYLSALQNLKSAVDLAAQNPPTDAAGFAPVSTAVEAARGAVKPMTLTFNIDPDKHTERTVSDLMLAPIECVAGLMPSPGAKPNGGGKAMCDKIASVLGKFPFSPNSNAPAAIPEVDGIFAPETGAIWTIYKDALDKSVVLQGTQYVPAPTAPGPVNPRFVAYFNRVAHISSSLYASGHKSAWLKFNLHFSFGGSVSSATFVVDGQRIPTGSSSYEFTWNGTGAQSASLVADTAETRPYSGPWSVFQLVRDARISPTLSGYRLDYSINNAITIQGRAASGQTGGTKLATFELSGPGTDLLAGDGLAVQGCVPTVILPSK